jgi:hypothetical protein
MRVLIVVAICLPWVVGFQSAPPSKVSDQIETHRLIVSDSATGHRVFEVYVDQLGTHFNGESRDARARWVVTLRPFGAVSPGGDDPSSTVETFYGDDAFVGATTYGNSKTTGPRVKYMIWNGLNGLDFDTNVARPCGSPRKYIISPPKLMVEFGGSAPQNIATWSSPAWTATPCK